MDLRFLQPFQDAGLTPSFKPMSNEETRYSVMGQDGSGWIMTKSGPTGGWQNSHYHGGLPALTGKSQDGIIEHYFVVSGWVAVAVMTPGVRQNHKYLHFYGPMQNFTFMPGEMHNLYLSPDTVIHTIKVPVGAKACNPDKNSNDWWPVPELDKFCQTLTPQSLAVMRDQRLNLLR